MPWFWTDQYDMNLQMAGAPAAGTSWSGAATPADPGFTVFHLADGKPVAATTVNNARDMRFAPMLIAARQAGRSGRARRQGREASGSRPLKSVPREERPADQLGEEVIQRQVELRDDADAAAGGAGRGQ